MRKIFLATAKDGKLDWGSFTNEMMLRDALKETEGKTWRLELPEIKRTDSQNRFYWNYLEVIEKETGNTALDLHEYFKRTLLPPRFITIKIDGVIKEIKIPASTTKLSKIEMGEYMDKICAETGIPIPNPELMGYTAWNEK